MRICACYLVCATVRQIDLCVIVIHLENTRSLGRKIRVRPAQPGGNTIDKAGVWIGYGMFEGGNDNCLYRGKVRRCFANVRVNGNEAKFNFPAASTHAVWHARAKTTSC